MDDIAQRRRFDQQNARELCGLQLRGVAMLYLRVLDLSVHSRAISYVVATGPVAGQLGHRYSHLGDAPQRRGYSFLRGPGIRLPFSRLKTRRAVSSPKQKPDDDSARAAPPLHSSPN